MPPSHVDRTLLQSISQTFGLLLSRFSPCDFRIVCRPGKRVEVRGKIARAKMAGIVRFFADELNLPSAVTILGTGGKTSGTGGKPLRLRFAGNIPAGDRQRVRNYLMVQLG